MTIKSLNLLFKEYIYYTNIYGLLSARINQVFLLNPKPEGYRLHYTFKRR